jgi:DNA-binding CsgD family transcriptional regulator
MSEAEEVQIFDYLKPVRAFARATNTSVYVIDYMKQGFEYVSDNPLFLCGNTAEEVLEMGYGYYLKYVPDKDLELLLKINAVGFDFYERLPLEDRMHYSISYDFHLKNDEGKLILINQKLTPMFLTDDGKIWKAICIVSLSSEKSSGNVKIYRSGENKVYNYNLCTNVWEVEHKMTLTKREVEILQYSVRGYTINEIADAIFVSPDTVKFHRKKLFEKIDVTSITEAIAYATNNKLI